MFKLDTNFALWDRVFLVAPLVLIGTRDQQGEPNLAPKHMAGPVSWDNFFGFVCATSHSTWKNATRSGSFAVSYPRPDQVLQTALAASPCQAENAKVDILNRLSLVAAPIHGDPLLADAQFHLECELQQQVEIGANILLIGKVVAAAAHPKALRHSDADEHEQIHQCPLLAYLPPGRYAVVEESQAFPFPRNYQR